MTNELAEQTLKTLDNALKEGRIASMPELVRIIRALSKDEGSVSIGELAGMINQDSTVLMRVISAANTFGYNPNNLEITTVVEAIHTIGFNRVRMLAMSLMLLDHADRQVSPTEQRRLAAVSLCSGMLAQVTAEHAGSLNPELAFVCASLRNFGQLLLGTFMIDEFRAAGEAAAAGEGDDAYRRHFGLTPFQLGYELLKSANLPPIILHAVRQHEPPAGAAIAWSDKVMHRLSTFALELSEIALDGDVDDATFAKAQEGLVKRFGRDFPFLVERAPNLLREAEQRLARLTGAVGGAGIGRAGRERLRDRARRTPLDGKPEFSTAPATPAKPAAKAPAPAPIPAADLAAAAPATPSASAVDLARQKLAAGGGIANALPVALNAVWNTLRPQDIFFCSPDPVGRAFRIIIGNGPLNDTLADRALFHRQDRNVFFLCHDRLINLSVQNSEDAKVWRHLPDWLRTPTAPRSFLALPVHHQRRLQGVLFVGWAQARAQPCSSEELATLQSLFELVAAQTRTSARERSAA